MYSMAAFVPVCTATDWTARSAMTVLILGGYGNFGKRIARLLTRRGIAVVIAGRDRSRADAEAKDLPSRLAASAAFDITIDLPRQLELLRPRVVINTCGPFQNADYAVAQACIAAGVHYIDLSDGRDFVAGIGRLDAAARERNVQVVSGASTVPALTSAVIEHYLPRFARIEALTFGIAPGQRTERGLATTQAILSYVGMKLRACAGYAVRYGWQDLYRQAYPGLGNRWMANCDVPDLDLLPARYGIARIRFSSGMENPLIHCGMWLLSWAVRIGMPLDLPRHAALLLAASHWFDFTGSADSGMHVIMDGMDHSGRSSRVCWFIIARDGDGPYIPSIPAVLLAEKLSTGVPFRAGAMPCVGMVALQDYLGALEAFEIKTYESEQRTWQIDECPP
jgi:hypothetical protein